MKELFELCESFFDRAKMPKGYKNPEDDKRCFKVALKQFLASGRKEDAFVVYFCFSEIFKLFGSGYDNTKKLLETLSDHEYHSGELLTKHRDHYSHSVYVFALGIAIFNNDPSFKKAYCKFYGFDPDDPAADCNFWRFWGMTSLFHDIGYPFQLAHEQIKTYSSALWGEKNPNNPYVSYGNIDNFIALNDNIKCLLRQILPDAKDVETINDLLAYGLEKRCEYDAKAVGDMLFKRVVKQPAFMDHGYFSAAILASRIFALEEPYFSLQHLDVLTAILLHNNLNKHDIPNAHLIDRDEHPLAYLLMLCDELQCWDRLAYGKTSKRAPLAWKVELNIFEGHVIINYAYDSFTIKSFGSPDDAADVTPIIAENFNYSEMRNGKFLEKIFGTKATQGEDAAIKRETEGKKVYPGYITDKIKVTVRTQEAQKKKRIRLYVSDDNFIELCDLAKAIHASYDEHCLELSNDHIEKEFAKLPLEFKVSNIEQAKSYGYKLELINCFYSSKDLDYPIVEDFEHSLGSEFSDNLGFLCREEHVRWVKERLAMGWHYGTDYSDKKTRDEKKINRSLVPYDCLPEETKSTNEMMIKNIFTLLKKFDSNIKVYNYRSGRKPTLDVAGAGHRFYTENEEALKSQIKNVLAEFQKTHSVVVRTCFAYGADQLIAECAIELGIPIKADLPMDYEDYIADVRQDALSHGRPFGEKEEMRMRDLLAQAVVCRVIKDNEFIYAESTKYIVKKADRLIALWDEKALDLYDKDGKAINRGGTYDCIKMAEAKGMKQGREIIVIDCFR